MLNRKANLGSKHRAQYEAQKAKEVPEVVERESIKRKGRK